MPLLSGKAQVIGSKPSWKLFADPNLEKYAPYDFIKIYALAPGGCCLQVSETRRGGWLTKKLIIGGEALRLSFNLTG